MLLMSNLNPFAKLKVKVICPGNTAVRFPKITSFTACQTVNKCKSLDRANVVMHIRYCHDIDRLVNANVSPNMKPASFWYGTAYVS